MLKQYKIFFTIALPQKELPTEECIWCKEKSNKNIAHIISKGLMKTDHFSNKLNKSVCENCNTFFGQSIEDWIFKYSPISFWINRDIKNTMKINDDRAYKYKQIFIWFKKINEWFVALNEDSNQLPSQLVCNNKYELTFFYHSKNGTVHEKANYPLLEKFIYSIRSDNYSYYISELLPKNFNSRVFKYNDCVIIIAKTKENADLVLDVLKNLKDINNIKFKNFYSSEKEHKHLIINYKWSIRKHYKYCSKIAFEYLSLIQGSNFVKNSEFDGFKKFMLEKEKNEFSNVLFINGIGINEKRLTLNGWVDVSNEAHISKKTIIPTFNLNALDNYTFSMIIYKYDSHICASIKLFEFDPCNIILSKTTQDFQTLHLITYSAKEDKLHFYETTTDLGNFDQDLIFTANEASLYRLGK